jgi:hypothetical protein
MAGIHGLRRKIPLEESKGGISKTPKGWMSEEDRGHQFEEDTCHHIRGS